MMSAPIAKKVSRNLLVKARLTFRYVDGVVRVYDSVAECEWDTTDIYVRMLLASSFKDQEARERLYVFDTNTNIFDESDLRVFDGYFPVDQMIFQLLALRYEVFPDQKARAYSYYRPDLFLSVDYGGDIPTIEEVSPEKGDYVSCWDTQGDSYLIKMLDKKEPAQPKLKGLVVAAAFIVLALWVTLFVFQNHSGASHLQASEPNALPVHQKS